MKLIWPNLTSPGALVGASFSTACVSLLVLIACASCTDSPEQSQGIPATEPHEAATTGELNEEKVPPEVAEAQATSSAETPPTVQSVVVGPDDSGKGWPFTQPSIGLLYCVRKISNGVSHDLVIIELDGTPYGLNDSAVEVGGLQDARKLATKGEQGATEALIKQGLSLCGK